MSALLIAICTLAANELQAYRNLPIRLEVVESRTTEIARDVKDLQVLRGDIKEIRALQALTYDLVKNHMEVK